MAATKSLGKTAVTLAPSSPTHLSISVRQATKDEVTVEDKHDTNSDEVFWFFLFFHLIRFAKASSDDVEQFPLILEPLVVPISVEAHVMHQAESPEVPSRVERRKSFLGGLAPRRKSIPEMKLQSVSLEDMTTKINAKQLALCLKELKEGSSETISFEGIKLSPRELKKITSLVKKSHKAHQKNKVCSLTIITQTHPS